MKNSTTTSGHPCGCALPNQKHADKMAKMSIGETNKEWMDCGDGTLLHPVSHRPIATRVVELTGFGRIGEWYDHEGSEVRFQKILKAVNSHDALMAALKSLLRVSYPTGQDTRTDRAMNEARRAISQAEGGGE